MVEPSAPLVPRYDDRRAVPVLTLPDGVDDRGNPRGAAITRSAAGVIRRSLVRHHPRHLRDVILRYVREDLRVGRHDVLVVLPEAHGFDCVERIQPIGIVRVVGVGAHPRRGIGLLVPAPRHVRIVQQIGNRLVREAWVGAPHFVPDCRWERRRLSGPVVKVILVFAGLVAAPGHCRRNLRGVAVLPRNHFLMLAEAGAVRRAEVVIAERVLRSHRPVRLDFGPIHVRKRHLPMVLVGVIHPARRLVYPVGSIAAFGCKVAVNEPVPAVVLTAVGVFEKLVMIVVEVEVELEVFWHHRIFDAVAVAERCGFGARESVEHVVEAAVLLHDDDDVRDRIGTRMGTIRCVLRHHRKRSLRVVRTACSQEKRKRSDTRTLNDRLNHRRSGLRCVAKSA